VNKKWVPYLLIALLAVALFVIKQYKSSKEPVPKPKVTDNDRPKDPASNPTDRDKGFDRRTSYLKYSNHAKCRMQCRKISQAEVEEIMREGKINYNKSDLKDKPCPTYALEGITKDNQRVRVVVGDCNNEAVIITVIDLDHEFECTCD